VLGTDVVACADAGNWLKVKIHKEPNRKASKRSNDAAADSIEWGWSLVADKSTVFLTREGGESHTSHGTGANSGSGVGIAEGTSSGATHHTTRVGTASHGGELPPLSNNGSNSKGAPAGSTHKISRHDTPPRNRATGGGSGGLTSTGGDINHSNDHGSAHALKSPNGSHYVPTTPIGKHTATMGNPLGNRSMRALPKYPNEHPKSRKNSAKDAEIPVWMELFDEGGHAYYYNEATQESSWDPPAWVEEKDPSTGSK
jgi:hypothetical protein